MRENEDIDNGGRRVDGRNLIIAGRKGAQIPVQCYV